MASLDIDFNGLALRRGRKRPGANMGFNVYNIHRPVYSQSLGAEEEANGNRFGKPHGWEVYARSVFHTHAEKFLKFRERSETLPMSCPVGVTGAEDGRRRRLQIILELDKKAAGTVIRSFAYVLHAAGNRLSVTDRDSKYTSYGLDPEYQLKSETKWSAKAATATREFQYAYGYDPNGNRIKLFDDGVQTTSTFGDNNEQLTFGAASLTYDHFGNTTAIGSDTFTWDFEGHLLTATRPGTPNSVDTHEVNGDGVRMRSKLNNASDWTNFIYDPLEGGYPALLAEYTLISGTFTLKSVCTHGVGLTSTNRESTKRYFHFDGLGSCWALTDSSEAIQNTYIWSAFGIEEASTGSSVNPFGYVGQWGYYNDGLRGSQLGLILLGVRFYHASTGRFLTWDPTPQDALYAYCDGRPLELIDPLGDRAVLPSPSQAHKGNSPLCQKMCDEFCKRTGWRDTKLCKKKCAQLCAYFGAKGCGWLLDHCLLTLKNHLHVKLCMIVYNGMCSGGIDDLEASE